MFCDESQEMLCQTQHNIHSRELVAALAVCPPSHSSYQEVSQIRLFQPFIKLFADHSHNLTAIAAESRDSTGNQLKFVKLAASVTAKNAPIYYIPFSVSLICL
jgi:hypothetical protein